jgi:hypothetical protein
MIMPLGTSHKNKSRDKPKDSASARKRLSMPIKAKCHLTDMGPEKYKKAIERLMAGVLAATVAKEISKEFPGVPIPLLAQKLRRARAAAKDALARLKLEQANHQLSQSRIKDIHHSSMQVLSALISITHLQRTRVERFYQQELQQSTPNPRLNALINDYCAQLAQVQKAQFDLGINEFKGPLNGMRGVIDKRTWPDGTHQERHVFEAIAAVEEIFRKRGIPEHPQLTEGNER